MIGPLSRRRYRGLVADLFVFRLSLSAPSIVMSLLCCMCLRGYKNAFALKARVDCGHVRAHCIAGQTTYSTEYFAIVSPMEDLFCEGDR
jgi:hypothetical protein